MNYKSLRKMINKVFRCLNHIQQPKVIVISESKDLSTIDLTIMFDKLSKHEIELNRLESKEDNKKNKGLAIKTT